MSATWGQPQYNHLNNLLPKHYCVDFFSSSDKDFFLKVCKKLFDTKLYVDKNYQNLCDYVGVVIYIIFHVENPI